MSGLAARRRNRGGAEDAESGGGARKRGDGWKTGPDLPSALPSSPPSSAPPRFLLICALLLPACADESPPPSHARGAVPPGEDLGVLDTLAAVGYVDYAEPDGELASGVVVLDPGRAAGGYTLVTSLPNSRATLVDMQGNEVRTWVDPQGTDSRWSRARLLRNGDVLCISPKADYLARSRFDGTELWRLPLEVHHDGIELPDGRLLVLTRRFRSLPEVDPERRSVDNLLVFVSADGKVLEEHSLYDLL